MPTLVVKGVGEIDIPDSVPKSAYDAIVKDAVAKKGAAFSSPKQQKAEPFVDPNAPGPPVAMLG